MAANSGYGPISAHTNNPHPVPDDQPTLCQLSWIGPINVHGARKLNNGNEEYYQLLRLGCTLSTWSRSRNDTGRWSSRCVRYIILTGLSFACIIEHKSMLFHSVSAEIDLAPIPGQLRPKKHVRLHPPVSAWIEHGRPPQLILGKVDISIRRH